jgi:hypothetical protein
LWAQEFDQLCMVEDKYLLLFGIGWIKVELDDYEVCIICAIIIYEDVGFVEDVCGMFMMLI